MKKYVCTSCGNEDWFVATYRLHGECVTDQYGTDVEGVGYYTSNNPHVDESQHVDVDEPYKCAKCGAETIVRVDN